MTYISVEPTVLRTVADRLIDAVAVAGEVKHQRNQLEGRLGGEHRLVRGATHSFLERWAFGCECLIADATEISGRLNNASQCYVDVEASIERAIPS